ncbi:hypothetical protein V7O62_04410 [Methanolobus sp. ZRKC2]|uniref:hypothetical protein n=1 Tax=Methanolobus sp. ZRKC2 TaxID=3125783 RepID=UPI0032502D6E
MGKISTKIVATLLILTICVSITSANQTNDSDKYTLDNYGGEKFTPQPMEFGENIRTQEQNGATISSTNQENATERKHVLLQFYSTPNDEQLELLKEYGVQRVGVAADYTYIVLIPAGLTPADLPAESGLRWMGELPVENKYDPSFGLNVPERARTEDGQVELWLAFYEDVTFEEAQAIANKYSTSSPKFEMYPYSFNSIITTNESNLTVIASEDYVERIVFGREELVPESDSSADIKQSPGFESVLVFLLLSAVFLCLKRGDSSEK